MPLDVRARTRQKRVPVGSVLVLTWLVVTFLLRTSGAVNAGEVALPSPAAVAASRYPVPALSMLKSLNVLISLYYMSKILVYSHRC